MALTISESFSRVTTPIVDGAKRAYKEADKKVCWAYGKVEDLTYKALPPTAAKIVCDLIKASPIAVVITVGCFAAPAPVFLGAIMGLSAMIIINPQILTERRIVVLYNANGLSAAINAVIFGSMICKLNHPSLIAPMVFITLAEVALAAIFFSRARSLEKRIEG